jgi:maleylacetate reductase
MLPPPLAFVHEPSPQRIVFGASALVRIAEEAERLNFSRIMVLTSPEQVPQGQAVAELLGWRAAGLFSEATMHTPVAVTERACVVARQKQIDGLVAIGGGSTVGLGKAVTLRTDLPQIAIPTTYAGSEMTDLIGQTADGRKVTERSPKIRPKTVIYDVDLTLSLSPMGSVLSGLNAIAHAAEALYSPDSNPITALMAEDGIRALAAALPAILTDPTERAGRSEALYGAWLCGSCLGSTTMGLHHKLCHVLGGAFNLPHAEMHSVLLPYSLAFNAVGAPGAMAAVTRAFQGRDPIIAIVDILAKSGARRSLSEIGMPADGVEATVRTVMEADFPNPRKVTAEALSAMLTTALHGETPDRAGFAAA